MVLFLGLRSSVTSSLYHYTCSLGNDGYYSYIASFGNLPTGQYLISQNPSNRYTLKNIKTTSKEITISQNSASINLQPNINELCEFYSSLTDTGKTSDNKNSKQIMSVEKQPVNISVSYPDSTITDSLDKSKISITVTYDNGTTKTISGSNPNIKISGRTAFSSSNLGNNTINIIYSEAGKNISKDFPFTVSKWPTELETSYDGTTITKTLNKSHISATVIYCDGSSKKLAPNEFSCTPTTFSESDSGKNQIITVSYSENNRTMSSDLNVPISKWPISIDVNYAGGTENDALDKSRFSGTVHYSDGSSSEIPGTDLTYSKDTFSNSDIGKTNNVSVSYTANGETVEQTIPIEVASWPVKMNVTYSGDITNSKLDLSKITAIVTDCNGSKKTIPISDLHLSKTAFSSSDIGTQIITATYSENGKTISGNFTVTIQKWPTSIKASITNTNVNDALKHNEVTAVVTYCDGSTSAKSGNQLSFQNDTFSSSQVGTTQNVTISYSENNTTVTDTLPVQVKKWPIKLSATYSGGTVSFNVDKSKVNATVTYCDNTSVLLDKDSNDLHLSPTSFPESQSGTTQNITATYSENGKSVSADFAVNVGRIPISMQLQHTPSQITSLSLDTTPITAIITYQDGSSQTVNSNALQFLNTSFSNTDIGTSKTITVQYSESGKTISSSFSVLIKKIPTTLVISCLHGVVSNQRLDTNKITGTVYYNDGSLKTIHGSQISYSQTSFPDTTKIYQVIATYTENDTTLTSQFTISNNELTGKVTNIDGTNLQNTSVKLIPYNSSSQTYDNNNTILTTTDSNGQFDTFLGKNSYKIIYEKDNYLPLTTYQTIDSEGLVSIETVPLVPIPSQTTQTGSVTGYVKNAINNCTISDATIKFRKNWNVKSGPYACDANNSEFTANSTSNGYFNCNLPYGYYTAEISKSGFVTGLFNITICNQSASVNAILSPVLASNEYRIVLTWGASPRDLDSHLTSTIGQEVYFGRRNVSYSDSGSANLDVDDTSSYGPETITLLTGNNSNATYTYSVYNYSGYPALSTSGAAIKIYNGNSLISSYSVPTNGGSGRTWKVFSLCNGKISPINTIA